MDKLNELLRNNSFEEAIEILEKEGFENTESYRDRASQVNKCLAADIKVTKSGERVDDLLKILRIDIRTAHNNAMAKSDISGAVSDSQGPSLGQTNGNMSIAPAAGANEALRFLINADTLKIKHYTIVKGYVRFRPPEDRWKELSDFVNNLLRSCTKPSTSLENYLVYAPPGEGKTFLVKQFWEHYGGDHRINRVNLDMKTGYTEITLKEDIEACKGCDRPVLCIIDEIDKVTQPTLITILHDSVELNQKQNKSPNVVFVAIGSSGGSVEGLKEVLVNNKGKDLATRLQTKQDIPIASVGDRMVIAAQEARDAGIYEIDKKAMLFIMCNRDQPTIRNLVEWMRMDPIPRAIARCGNTDRKDLRYGDLFEATSQSDKAQKQFLSDYETVLHELNDSPCSYITIDD
jgi:hypothetical protein